MFESPKKFQTTSKSDFTSFYIALLIFHESQIFKISVIFIIDQSDSFPKKVPEKEEMERVAEQLGLRGRLNDSKINELGLNEFWVDLQKEPDSGQWRWNKSPNRVLKYTYNNFGHWAMLKGTVRER